MQPGKPCFCNANFYATSQEHCFIKIGLKFLFLQKKNFFSSAGGLRPQTPAIAPTPLQVSGYAPESNHGFAQLISMLPGPTLE